MAIAPSLEAYFFAYLYTTIEETSLAPHQIVIFVTHLILVNVPRGFVIFVPQ